MFLKMEKRSKKHALLMAYPAFGMITPTLQLARELLARGFQVTFAVSRHLIDDMRQRSLLSAQEERLFNLTGIEDDVSHTLDLDFSSKSCAALLEQLEAFQRDLLTKVPTSTSSDCNVSYDYDHIAPVDLVIIDICCIHAVVSICKQRRIPAYAFSTMAAQFVLHFFILDANRPTIPDDMLLKPPVMGYSTKSLRYNELKIQEGLLAADGVQFNSFEALEPNFMASLAQQAPRFSTKPIHFLGPLLSKQGTTDSSTSKAVVRWLDQQKARSVIYLSFGTIANASREQIQEIAQCLTSLNRPFIWSIRTAQQCHLPTELQSRIDQYEYESTFLVVSWAPQSVILQHDATRVFVSHCGWNSTLDGIVGGVPFVAWPFFYDQHTDAQMLGEMKCGLMVPDTDMATARLVSAKELRGLIDGVAQWQTPVENNEMFQNAQKMSEKAREAVKEGGNSYKSLELLCQ